MRLSNAIWVGVVGGGGHRVECRTKLEASEPCWKGW